MKKLRKFVIYLLASILLLAAGLAAYTNLVEGRSARSWLVERYLFLQGKSSLTEQSQESFAKVLQAGQAKSDQAYPNPEKWVGMPVTETSVDGMQTFVWNDKKDKNQKAILYIHGGGYLNQPTSYHFETVAALAKQLDAKVVFPIYPKVPRYSYKDAFPKMLTLYKEILENTSADKLTVMGDSAGGGFSLGLALALKDENLPQPKDIILLSPWVDVKTDNPDIADYEAKDPMLSAWGLNQQGAIWAGGASEMDNPYVSPIKGDLTGLGKISIFVGTHEIFLPDNEKLSQKLTSLGIDHNYTVADKMNHVYAIYPIPEAKKAQAEIVTIIEQD
ncbi:alpha/beta hydrolase fold domain-containing protein [Streptococcus cuniculipharyngis]|uniref:Alpha/beta hydrolase n=1 Tax=Streptococcus cuniculipharyngis TaxID=1562651 RepID=A0A5C5SEX9_9STRE|nr:alpha/beta hydrolase [Streptococcus cuniculipharyngis]TWS98683.1 alpha/beta hydrolase [Streptococcus cuniculipharyngis]